MSDIGHLDWMPDLRLPADRRALQEFIRHERESTLRIILHTNQRAQVEVNDQLVTETVGFQSAAALAELYTRDREILLTVPDKSRYYHLRFEDDAYDVCVSADPQALVYKPEEYCLTTRLVNVVEAIEEAAGDAKTSLCPAFSDQEALYRGLGCEGTHGLVVSAWVSRWQMPLLTVVEEDLYAPLRMMLFKGPDGAFYSLYRLVSGEYVTEVRSRHDAEQIGGFSSVEVARAYSTLFNAARHSGEWVRFPETQRPEADSPDGRYVLSDEGKSFRLGFANQKHQVLGHFSSIRVAEAYATVHRDALNHFGQHIV